MRHARRAPVLPGMNAFFAFRGVWLSRIFSGHTTRMVESWVVGLRIDRVGARRIIFVGIILCAMGFSR